jgi:nucleoside-diphosphate-sugar epimerase
MNNILITGAFGLVGTDLVDKLISVYGSDSVVVLKRKSFIENHENIHVEEGDVRDITTLEPIFKKYNINEIYHLAGLISVASEEKPDLAWEVNAGGLKKVLDLSVKYKCKVFWPSSIAAFGPTTPKQDVPQHTILEPTTMYGVNKVTGELLCQYYHQRYGLDVRSLRYPGLLGWKAEPGNGTTEYAIWMMYAAVKNETYTCYLNENSRLPMMHIDDAIKGTLQLMEAPAENIQIRTSYNFGAISFTPKELEKEIQRTYPNFSVRYEPDERQKIADSWPQSINDIDARKDWKWQPDYKLPELVVDLLQHIKVKLEK